MQILHMREMRWSIILSFLIKSFVCSFYHSSPILKPENSNSLNFVFALVDLDFLTMMKSNPEFDQKTTSIILRDVVIKSDSLKDFKKIASVIKIYVFYKVEECYLATIIVEEINIESPQRIVFDDLEIGSHSSKIKFKLNSNIQKHIKLILNVDEGNLIEFIAISSCKINSAFCRVNNRNFFFNNDFKRGANVLPLQFNEDEIKEDDKHQENSRLMLFFTGSKMYTLTEESNELLVKTLENFMQYQNIKSMNPGLTYKEFNENHIKHSSIEIEKGRIRNLPTCSLKNSMGCVSSLPKKDETIEKASVPELDELDLIYSIESRKNIIKKQDLTCAQSDNELEKNKINSNRNTESVCVKSIKPADKKASSFVKEEHNDLQSKEGCSETKSARTIETVHAKANQENILLDNKGSFDEFETLINNERSRLEEYSTRSANNNSSVKKSTFKFGCSSVCDKLSSDGVEDDHSDSIDELDRRAAKKSDSFDRKTERSFNKSNSNKTLKYLEPDSKEFKNGRIVNSDSESQSETDDLMIKTIHATKDSDIVKDEFDENNKSKKAQKQTDERITGVRLGSFATEYENIDRAKQPMSSYQYFDSIDDSNYNGQSRTQNIGIETCKLKKSENDNENQNLDLDQHSKPRYINPTHAKLHSRSDREIQNTQKLLTKNYSEEESKDCAQRVIESEDKFSVSLKCNENLNKKYSTLPNKSMKTKPEIDVQKNQVFKRQKTVQETPIKEILCLRLLNQKEGLKLPGDSKTLSHNRQMASDSSRNGEKDFQQEQPNKLRSILKSSKSNELLDDQKNKVYRTMPPCQENFSFYQNLEEVEKLQRTNSSSVKPLNRQQSITPITKQQAYQKYYSNADSESRLLNGIQKNLNKYKNAEEIASMQQSEAQKTNAAISSSDDLTDNKKYYSLNRRPNELCYYKREESSERIQQFQSQPTRTKNLSLDDIDNKIKKYKYQQTSQDQQESSYRVSSLDALKSVIQDKSLNFKQNLEAGNLEQPQNLDESLVKKVQFQCPKYKQNQDEKLHYKKEDDDFIESQNDQVNHLRKDSLVLDESHLSKRGRKNKDYISESVEDCDINDRPDAEKTNITISCSPKYTNEKDISRNNHLNEPVGINGPFYANNQASNSKPNQRGGVDTTLCVDTESKNPLYVPISNNDFSTQQRKTENPRICFDDSFDDTIKLPRSESTATSRNTRPIRWLSTLFNIDGNKKKDKKFKRTKKS